MIQISYDAETQFKNNNKNSTGQTAKYEKLHPGGLISKVSMHEEASCYGFNKYLCARKLCEIKQPGFNFNMGYPIQKDFPLFRCQFRLENILPCRIFLYFWRPWKT